MTAEELYAILVKMSRKERESARVVLASDAEGNDYRPVHVCEMVSAGELDVSRVTNDERSDYAESPLLTLWPR